MYDKVVSVSAISNRRLPLPVLSNRDRAAKLDTEVPCPAVLASLVAQVFRLQPRIKLVEHDVGVKGTKAQAEEIREECRAFLQSKLKLTLNMEKTPITHVNDGFVFLGHRIIRKRGSHGRMSVVTTIPKEKAKGFVRRLTEALSGNHSVSTVDMIAGLNRQLAEWAAFHKCTDFTAHAFRRIDHVVFWKMAHWLGHKYRSRIKPLMRKWYRPPEPGKAKTWLVFGRNERGAPRKSTLPACLKSEGAVPMAQSGGKSLHLRKEARSTVTSHYQDVAMAMGQA
ncbi:hypothetical protein GGD62_006305 [Bradyrhizobium sp. ERR14]|nr:hypothetical protein [Bradyrhizobium sp. ERR14]